MTLARRSIVAIAVPVIIVSALIFFTIDSTIQKYVCNMEKAWLELKIRLISFHINEEFKSKNRILNDINTFVRWSFNDSQLILSVLTDISDEFPRDRCFYAGFADGRFFDGGGWIPEDGYDARTRPWYVSAFAVPDCIVYSHPYTDERTGQSCVTLSRSLQDSSGRTGGVVSVDFCCEAFDSFIKKEVDESHLCFIIDSDGHFIYGRKHSMKDSFAEMLGGATFPLNRWNGAASGISSSLRKSRILAGSPYWGFLRKRSSASLW